MRIVDIIAAKRDGRELGSEHVARIVGEFARGLVPDYQMSAFLMTVYLNGMTFEETSAMTRSMVESGVVLDLSGVPGTKIDKHSTGGVGDKTTLVVVPILAAGGLKVPKMSGRGLGFTGGTLDKLESIPSKLGTDTYFQNRCLSLILGVERFVEQIRTVGAAIAGQSPEMVPADKKMYALRDVTGTVESIPLIAASVMSKKIACSADVILLDVKVGSGAFMRDIGKARELARTMIAIGKSFGRTVGAMLTDMSQPLGNTIGNALEVAEAIETLKGGGPDDLARLCVELSGTALNLAGVCSTDEEGRSKAQSVLRSGAALEMFGRIIEAQDGDPRVLDDPSLLPQAQHVIEVASQSEGYVTAMDCAAIGRAAMLLGAGREKKEDKIDPAVGITVLKKLGDYVERGEPLTMLHANDRSRVAESTAVVQAAYTLGDEVEIPPLVLERIV